MCAILLSIKPEYVNSIMSGEKIYEYRKLKCRQDVDKIFIYSTNPVMKVVGEADVESVLEGTPNEIWEKTKKNSGVNKTFFDKYYQDKLLAIAYKLCNIRAYKNPKDLNDFGIKNPPQSFQYIKIK